MQLELYYPCKKKTSVGLMKGVLMKKSSFVALVLGTISGVLFALGMCMALLPEWNAFVQGVVLGAAGMILGLITLLVWCKMEQKKLPKMNGRNILRTVYGIVSVLVLGTGMCMCLVWQHLIGGVLVGLLGIVMLLALIPMIKGIR
jgi:hypothetical protein